MPQSPSFLSSLQRGRRALYLSTATAGLALAVTSAACVIVRPPPAPCPSPRDTACTGRRFIGVINPQLQNACPKAPGWKEQFLFPTSASKKLPTSLQQYCLYEWVGPAAGGAPTPYEACPPYGSSGPPLADITALKATPGVADLAEDCMRVAPLGYEANLPPVLRSTFTPRVGGVSPLPSSSPFRPVRLAMEDTSPDALHSGLPIGQSRHGDTLGNIARDLACPGGAGPLCAAHLTTALALPRTDPTTVDLVNGGYYGTLGELAEAIRRTIDAWTTDVGAGTGEPRLVMNLSVGWDDVPGTTLCHGATPETDPTTLDTPARAVFHAVRNAACHGALLVAAAGNDTGGPKPSSGLTCPAHWESVPVPEESVCLQETGTFEQIYRTTFDSGYTLRPNPRLAPPTLHNRLIYAAGGVDYGDAPLVMTRRGGRPRLAALALAGAAWDTVSPSGATIPAPPQLTGTSVSAAVVSGIAAAAWAYRPELTAPEILDLVYRSGASLSTTADACSASGAAACTIRRASLCNTLVQAGILAASACADARSPALAVAPVQNPAFPSNLLTELRSDFGSVAPILVTMSAQTTSPVAHDQYPMMVAAPWNMPQPVWPACPSCVLALNDRSTVVLYAKPGVEFHNPALIMIDQGGTARSVLLPTSGNALRAGAAQVFQVTFAAGIDATATRRAWISGITADGAQTSISQQILITATR